VPLTKVRYNHLFTEGGNSRFLSPIDDIWLIADVLDELLLSRSTAAVKRA
jgi:hypothetical protein